MPYYTEDQIKHVEGIIDRLQALIVEKHETEMRNQEELREVIGHYRQAVEPFINWFLAHPQLTETEVIALETLGLSHSEFEAIVEAENFHLAKADERFNELIMSHEKTNEEVPSTTAVVEEIVSTSGDKVYELYELDDLIDEGVNVIGFKAYDHNGDIVPVVEIDGTPMLQLERPCSRCGQHPITVYAASGLHKGAFAYMYDKQGNYLYNRRDEVYVCKECHQS